MEGTLPKNKKNASSNSMCTQISFQLSMNNTLFEETLRGECKVFETVGLCWWTRETLELYINIHKGKWTTCPNKGLTLVMSGSFTK